MKLYYTYVIMKRYEIALVDNIDNIKVQRINSKRYEKKVNVPTEKNNRAKICSLHRATSFFLPRI